jgi:class 3 adenylate cyclase
MKSVPANDATPSSSSSATPENARPHHAAEGERRQITVLFADVVGFTAFAERFGEEASYSLMKRVSGLLTECVHQQGGVVKSFTGDGVMALFGFPTASEHAPLRACRAALCIQQQLSRKQDDIGGPFGVRPQIRIGVNTGPAILGEVQSGESTSITALGDTVNLASRLQAQAEPGCVFITEATHVLVAGLVEAAFVGSLPIKGKTEAQNAYRLTGIREGAVRFDVARQRGLTEFVGRTRELEVLNHHLRASVTGLRVIDIAGEPGIGKSRLLYEFRQRLTDKDLFILAGSCSPDGRQTPFLPFLEVVRAEFRITVGEAESDVRRKLEDGLKVLSLGSPENVALLLNLLGLKAPENALAGLDGTLIGLRTRDLLLRLLNERCRLSPTMMLLEDLHWIDSVSEELISRTVSSTQTASLLVVHTRRPEYRPPWSDQPNVVPLPVELLSAGETQRIVQARMGVQLPDALGRMVAEKAEGNALFAEEIAGFLIERGLVRRTAVGLDYDPASVGTALPGSVQSLISARVDRLTPEDRTLLQAAAAIGRRFDPELLRSAADYSGNLAAWLEAMEASDLVRRHSESGDYLFKHALVRDALYNGILTPRRMTLHLNVASEIERRSANRPVEAAEVLAYHYSRTPRADKAFHYLALAGRKSLNSYSVEEAERFFRQAMHLLESEPSCADDQAVADVVVGLLEALFLRSDFPKAVRVADRYMPRLEAFGETPQLVFALYFYSMTLAQQCEFRRGELLGRRAFDIAERIGDVRARAYARIALMLSSMVLGRYSFEDVQRMGADGLADSRCCGDNSILNWAYWIIAWDCFGRGLMTEARNWALELIVVGGQREDRRALGFGYWVVAWVHVFEARYDEAIIGARECLRNATTPFDQNVAAVAEATAMILQGHVQEGLAKIEELRRRTLEHGWLYLDSGAHGPAGVGLAMSGQIAQGIRLIEDSIVAADACGSHTNAAWNRITLAEIYLEMLAGKQMPPLHVILRNLGTILGAQLFGRQRVLALLEKASSYEQLSERGTIRARIQMDLGLLYKIKKRPDLAREHLTRARAAAEIQNAAAMMNKIDAIMAGLRA